MKTNIGKNTIGDNGKMEVDLRTYNMSTHDLSTIVRNTQSPGTLVPNLCLVAQRGDIFDINIDANVLTHPTTGPLYGSFKNENHMFFIPFRLYNSWLHNNRTKIGLNMAEIKLPQISLGLIADVDEVTDGNEFTQINPSCLLAYLGLRGWGTPTGNAGSPISYNGVPVLGYYDIFKNFYANTQEEDMYVLGATNQFDVIASSRGWVSYNYAKIEEPIVTGDVITFSPNNIPESQIKITVSLMGSTRSITGTPHELGGVGSYVASTGKWTPEIPETEGWILMSVSIGSITALKKYPLSDLDDLRDRILEYKGNIPFQVFGDDTIPMLRDFQTRKLNNKLNTTTPQYGLALKTYNSDLYQNWINTEWIDGVNGINEVSAVDVTDGQLTMDALNLAQKVYMFLNRIAISGGTYKDWLETVYTSGQYIEGCETPTFEGGMSQEIIFQEVISNAASGEEPLGSLAGRGISTNKQKGGHIKIKCSEAGYIMCINSITPRIDYNQGNTWDMKLETMDDLHKPALDGIGYQDSLNDERAWWSGYVNNQGLNNTAAGKTVAWINYMTNVNRTFGNFAIRDNEGFMVLNRQYSKKTWDDETGFQIEDLTTYIDPEKFNYIFADTSIDAMNFWVQTKFDVKVRRLISAKQIPNL